MWYHNGWSHEAISCCYFCSRKTIISIYYFFLSVTVRNVCIWCLRLTGCFFRGQYGMLTRNLWHKTVPNNTAASFGSRECIARLLPSAFCRSAMVVAGGAVPTECWRFIFAVYILIRQLRGCPAARLEQKRIVSVGGHSRVMMLGKPIIVVWKWRKQHKFIYRNQLLLLPSRESLSLWK